MGIKKTFKKLNRKLDYSLLNDENVNTFEIRDKDNNVICNKLPEELDKQIDLKNEESKHFYFIGMTENFYTKDMKKPMTCNTTGVPSFEIIEYLHKIKKMSMLKLMILYYQLCEDCINELEYYIKGGKYERTGITECQYCKEIIEKEG